MMTFSKRYFNTDRTTTKHAKICYYFYHKNMKLLTSGSSQRNRESDNNVADVTAAVYTPKSHHNSCNDVCDVLSKNSVGQAILPNLHSVSNSILIINSEYIDINEMDGASHDQNYHQQHPTCVSPIRPQQTGPRAHFLQHRENDQ